MVDNDAPWAGPEWTPGARLAGFIKRITIHIHSIHCYTQNIKALDIAVSYLLRLMFSWAGVIFFFE